MPTQHCIVGLLYEDFETLDFFGPLGAILPRSHYYTLKVVRLHDLSTPNGVESSMKNGIRIMPNISMAEALKEEQVDTLFVPGGLGMRRLVDNHVLLQQIGQLVNRAANVFTVCTGSILLAATGRLNGRKATTNKQAYDELTPNHPGVQWQRRARWVQDGKFLTSSGVTAGIDAAFAFLSNTYIFPEDRKANPTPQKASAEGDATAIPGFNKEKSLEHARSVAIFLEYRWHEDSAEDPFAVDLPQSAIGSV